MKSVSADGTTIYMSVHVWSKYDKVPCLGAQAGDTNPHHNEMQCTTYGPTRRRWTVAPASILETNTRETLPSSLFQQRMPQYNHQWPRLESAGLYLCFRRHYSYQHVEWPPNMNTVRNLRITESLIGILNNSCRGNFPLSLTISPSCLFSLGQKTHQS